MNATKPQHCDRCGSEASVIRILNIDGDKRLLARVIACSKSGCLHVRQMDCGHCLRETNGAVEVAR